MTVPMARKTKSLRFLHLLWAVPTALVVSAPIWVIAQWGRCDYSSGRCGVMAASSIVGTLASSLCLLLVAGGLACTILLVAPWTENRKQRKLVAIISGAIVTFGGILPGLYWVIALF